MKNKINLSAISFIRLTIVLCLYFSSSHAQNYQQIPTGVCALVPDTSNCFQLNNSTYTVGKEVSLLSNLYKFCMNVYWDSTITGHASRIIIALDCSGSMCESHATCAGNDPNDMRITAANNFVDSVAKNCSDCQIGIVRYASNRSIKTKLNALPLNSTINIDTIHGFINQGKCDKHSAEDNPASEAMYHATYTGVALDTSIRMVDISYDSLIAAGMDRHIIILTDGDWQTPVPDTIYANYTTTYPTRHFPTVHGIFIQDSACYDSTIDLIYLYQSTQLVTRNATAPNTAGMYFPGTSAETIVATFDTLFKRIVIIDTSAIVLNSVTFTNTSTGISQNATLIKNSATDNSYIIKVPEFTLNFGTNKFIITMQITDTSGTLNTRYDTLTIIRNTSSGTGTADVFNDSCFVDTVKLSIACKPSSLQIPAYDTVTAKIAPEDTNQFSPNNIMLRAFVPFTNNETNTMALFHLNGNLDNNATNGTAGTGSPVFTSSDAAFGSAISSGSFQTTLASEIGSGNNFTVECWIKPPSASQAATIISGSGLTFTLTSDGYLSAVIGSSTIRTDHIIDKNVWQHVAVARVGSSANIYINGIPMATATSASGSISGALTVGPFTNGVLDEFRITNAVSSSTIQGKTVLTIPAATSLSWNINGTASTGANAWLPLTMWQNSPRGQAKFLFSSTMPGSMIINFFDTSSSPVSLMWSKNGDPVTFTTTNIVVNATLLDTSHNGYLDGINLTWTDAISVASSLPSVSSLVKSVIINTLDGKNDTLHPASLILDAANNTIRIVLTENSGYWETGWNSASVVIDTSIKLTTDNKSFMIGSIIDGATPIPVGACYAPASNSDSLYITFSEPLPPKGKDSTAKNTNIIRFNADNVTFTALSQLNPSNVYNTSDGRMAFVFAYAAGSAHVIGTSYKISEKFSSDPKSPAVSIDYCYIVRTQVTATLLDTSHNGYLDGINLTWSDNSTTIKSSLPDVNKLVKSAVISALNGKADTLHPSSFILDAANSTLRIVLAENSGYWETGWNNASITIDTTLEMTADGRPFTLVSIIDGATPIPVNACYEPSSSFDSLHITFSEPLPPAGRDSSADKKNILRYQTAGSSYMPLVDLAPSNVYNTANGEMVFVFPYTSGSAHAIDAYIYRINEKFSSGPNSTLTDSIPYCYPVPFIDTIQVSVLVGPSPYVFGTTSTIITKDSKEIKVGVKVQALINIPVIQDTGNGQLTTVVKGNIAIFDAVGNVLCSDTVVPDYAIKDAGTSQAKALSYIWPGTNKNGGKVAGGTYLSRITIHDIRSPNKPIIKLGKIGIKTSR